MLCDKWQYNLLFISCIYIHWNLRLHRNVTKTYEYWSFLLIKICAHVLCCIWYSILQIYIKGKSDKKCSTQSWLMGVGHVFFSAQCRGWVTKILCHYEGVGHVFLRNRVSFPPVHTPPPVLFDRPLKSSFVLFHPSQRKVEASINLYINDTSLKEKDNIKYLGIIIDSNLNWKKTSSINLDKNEEKYRYSIKTPLSCTFRYKSTLQRCWMNRISLNEYIPWINIISLNECVFLEWR